MKAHHTNWEEGETIRNTYSSLQLTYTFKTKIDVDNIIEQFLMKAHHTLIGRGEKN